MRSTIVLLSLAIGCSSRTQSCPPAPELAQKAPAPSSPQQRPLPPHTQLADPDLLRALCVMPKLLGQLHCRNVETGAAVVYAPKADARYPWIVMRCQAENVAKTAENFRTWAEYV